MICHRSYFLPCDHTPRLGLDRAALQNWRTSVPDHTAVPPRTVSLQGKVAACPLACWECLGAQLGFCCWGLWSLPWNGWAPVLWALGALPPSKDPLQPPRQGNGVDVLWLGSCPVLCRYQVISIPRKETYFLPIFKAKRCFDTCWLLYFRKAICSDFVNFKMFSGKCILII